MKEIIEIILEEVDADIKEIMLSDEDISKGNTGTIYENKPYKVWQLFSNPVEIIFMWQELRNRKNNG